MFECTPYSGASDCTRAPQLIFSFLCELQSFVLSQVDEGVMAHTPLVFAEQDSQLLSAAGISPPFLPHTNLGHPCVTVWAVV